LLTYVWVFASHKLMRAPEVMLRAILSQKLGISGYLRCPQFQYSGDAYHRELTGVLIGVASDDRSETPQLLTDLFMAFR
jgi:hypothetical protein